MQLGRAVVCALALVALWPAPARAQSWLSMRGGYYKEKSTRVTQPMLDAQIQATPRDQVQVHALVDSITSASPSAGSPVEFTERRYEAGVGYLRDLGGVRVGATARFSDESDYTSYYGALRGELELGQRNTTLALTVGRGFDTITDSVAGGARTEHLQVGLTSLAVTQVLTPRLVGTAVLDVSDLHGYQANLYRRVLGSDLPVEERVPDLRLRAALYLGARWFVPRSATTVIGGYRFYGDDWGVLAHTLEARVVQALVPGLEVRARYRFHTQGAADFYRDVYSKAELDDVNVHVTEDQKLSAFHTQTLGLQLTGALSLVGVSGLWGDTRVDVVVERVWQDNAFGDAWVAQLGLMVPLAN